MKNRTIILSLILAVLAVGCEGMGENTKKGAVVGTLLGAGTGAIIGNQSGNTGAGAAIGGAVGAVSGGLIGSSIDKTAAASQPAGEKVTLSDIVLLSKNKVGDVIIINKIKSTGSVFKLSSQEITMLKNEGVSDAVINTMLDSGAGK